MIKMNCPHCEHSLRIADEHSGKRGKCKYCGEYFIVAAAPVEPEFGEEKETQRARQRKEQEVARMADANRQLAEARAVASARKREREDRRSRFIFFGVTLLITGLIAGGGYWYMLTTGQDLPGVFLPEDAASEDVSVESAVLLGVPVPTFGEAAAPLDVSIEWSAAFEGIEKDSVSCYQIAVGGGYDEVVSKVQLALTRLGWDFTIWMGDEPVPQTELHGEVAGLRAAIRIEEVMDEVLDEVLVYAGVLSE